DGTGVETFRAERADDARSPVVPDEGAADAGGGENLTVRAEGHCQHVAAVPVERQDRRPRPGVPEADGAVLAAGGQPPAVAREGQRADHAARPCELMGQLARGCVPPDDAVGTPRDERLAVRGEDDRPDRLLRTTGQNPMENIP